MKKFWLGIVGLAAAATTADAAVLFTMSLDDNGLGAPTAGQWAVYASVSSDSQGLYGFGVDLLPFTGTLLNRANGVVMENSSDGAQLNLGFSAGRTSDAAAGKFSGLGDLGAGAAMKPVYTFGKQADNLNNYIPPEFDTQTAVFGAGRANYGVETWGGPTPGAPLFDGVAKNMFLLGRGNYTAGTPAFDTASVDTLASVYLTNTGTANGRAPLFFAARDLIVQQANSFTLDATATKGTNQAVGGNIAVTGANNSYQSEVDQLLGNVAIGNAPIATIGPEGPIYVMAKLTGTAADIAAFLADTTNDVGSGDSQFAPLHANYDAAFGAGGFNALFRFDASANNRTINWESTIAGVTVDQLAAVPEPASLGLLCVAGVGLLARRRRKA
jgi:hypothetical protein